MSTPLEHDYIGLSETSSRERSSEKIPSSSSSHSSSPSSSSTPSIEDKTTTDSHLNLKETEFRLGLPEIGVWSQKGFSIAIDGPNGKWVFSMNGKPDVDLAKGSVLASPRAVLEGKNNLSAMKEVGSVPLSLKPIKDKKNHVPPANEHSNAPASKYPQECVLHPVRNGTGRRMATNSIILEEYHGLKFGQCSSNELPVRDDLSESRLMDLLHGSEYVLTYEDNDGVWMLVDDVPWE
ncbi:hypothetical protein F3Y22_tig00000340pilonHSYRG01263 [Hibiscus syriacus]|uniref:Auxin-responsive protein n=1 Tax=Hibiscus syriacus TaxID=106335 RepID=A0A6A3D258_HIBSY|nr:hypothetical protein F3Y22_tig00000340pilonHSYRG01263 [Hibiscus syriacus]